MLHLRPTTNDLVKFIGHKTFTCEALVKKHVQDQELNRPTTKVRNYSFELSKADQNFDLLLESK